MSSSYKGPRATAKASATASRTASQETKTSGSNMPKNDDKIKQSSSKPDLTKYAKYLNQGDSLKFDETQYKPTIRAERHQVGYSAALNQRRNIANGDSATGVNEDNGHRRRPATRANIRSYSLNRAATGGNGASSMPSYQKNSDASASKRQQSRLGEDLPFRSRLPKEDVLDEEKTSNLRRTGISSDSCPMRDKVSSSSSSSEEKDTSKPFTAKMAGETCSEASRSSRTSASSTDRFRSRSRNNNTSENAPINESKDKNTFNASSTKEPSKRFFPTIDDFASPKMSTDNIEQTSSTPKYSDKTSDIFGSNLPQEKAEPRKTFLSAETSWNSKYFPSPYESCGERASRYGSKLDASSCRESPLRQDDEAGDELKYSPRPSHRNGLFEHLRSQQSRRSHSLDSRNRTPNREHSTHSPSPQSTKSGRSRIDQMNSLNESNFESKSAFKEHLLNLTMNKDDYEDLMSDFKNGSIIEDLDTVGTEHLPSVVPIIVVDQVNDNSDVIDSQSENESQTDPKGSTDLTTEQEAVPLKDSSDKNVNTDIGTDVPDSVCPKAQQENPTAQPETDEVKNSKQDMCNDDNNHQDSEKESSASYFRLLEELIQAARAKYSSPDMNKSSECQVIFEAILSEELTHKWRFQKTEFGIPTSMGVTSDGCVVVADYGNSCLEYFNAAGDFEHKIEGVKPFGIAVNKKDQIIVGDRRGKAIRVFDKFGADVAQWESKTFGWISGMAQLQNGHLVICDRDRCKIGIYTEGGEIISEFGSYGVNNSQICMADFLAVDSKDRIIVADSGNHCLKLFDTSGKVIGKIGSRGVDNGCLEWPKGICVDRNDNIIVADMHNNRISMFSTSGNFVQHLVSMTPNPYNVCYGKAAGLLGTLHYSLKGFSQYDVYTF